MTRATRSYLLQTGHTRLPAHGPVTHFGEKPRRLFGAPTGGPDRNGSAAMRSPANTKREQATLVSRHRHMVTPHGLIRGARELLLISVKTCSFDAIFRLLSNNQNLPAICPIRSYPAYCPTHEPSLQVHSIESLKFSNSIAHFGLRKRIDAGVVHARSEVGRRGTQSHSISDLGATSKPVRRRLSHSPSGATRLIWQVRRAEPDSDFIVPLGSRHLPN